MPASARLRVLTEYLTPADPQNFDDRSRPKNLKPSDNNIYAQQVVISNPSDAVVIGSFQIPMAQNEASRAWTQTTATAVTGITASGTGGLVGTFTFPARSSLNIGVTSTHNAPSVLVDQDGKSIPRSSSAAILRYTETTVNGVTVSPQAEVEVPLRPVNLGSGPFLFTFRNPDADTVLRGLVSGMTDADYVRLSAWLEEGNDLWDLVKRQNVENVMLVPAQATPGTADEWTVWLPKEARTVTAVSLVANPTWTGQAANFITPTLRNRGAAGAGTATIADLAFSSTAVVATANVEKPLTLSATPANLNVLPGDVVTLTRSVTGTGQATPSMSVVIRSRPLS